MPAFVARDSVVFIAGRIIEGLGGAAALACGLAILANDFPDAKRRTHATAVWGTSVATAYLSRHVRQPAGGAGSDCVESGHRGRRSGAECANNTARYLGAAIGITPFVVIVTHVGGGLIAGWNVAVLASATLTLLGAGIVLLAGKPARTKPLARATNGT